jgi:hypothetical protein
VEPLWRLLLRLCEDGRYLLLRWLRLPLRLRRLVSRWLPLLLRRLLVSWRLPVGLRHDGRLLVSRRLPLLRLRLDLRLWLLGLRLRVLSGRLRLGLRLGGPQHYRLLWLLLWLLVFVRLVDGRETFWQIDHGWRPFALGSIYTFLGFFDVALAGLGALPSVWTGLTYQG